MKMNSNPKTSVKTTLTSTTTDNNMQTKPTEQHTTQLAIITNKLRMDTTETAFTEGVRDLVSSIGLKTSKRIAWSISNSGANHFSQDVYELLSSDIEAVEEIVLRLLQPYWAQLVSHFERFGAFNDKSHPESKFRLEGDNLFNFYKNVFEETRATFRTTKTYRASLRNAFSNTFNESMEEIRVSDIKKHASERLRRSAEVLRRKSDRKIRKTPEWVITERKLALIAEKLIKADEERKYRGELTFGEHVAKFVKNLAVKAAWRLANPKTRSKKELDESIEIKSLESVVVNSFSQNDLGEISWNISDSGEINHSKSARYELFASDIEEVEGVVWRWLQPIWPQVVSHFERFGTFQWDKSQPESKFTLEGDELFAFWKNVFSEARTALEITKGGRSLRMKSLRPTVSLDAIESEAIRAMEESRLSEYIFEQEQITQSEHEDISANYDSLNMVEVPWVEHCERKEAERMERIQPDVDNAKTLAMRWIESADKYNPSRQKKERFRDAKRCIEALYYAQPEACEPVWLNGKDNYEWQCFQVDLARAKVFMMFGEGMEAIEETLELIEKSPFKAARRALRPIARLQAALNQILKVREPSKATLNEGKALVNKAQSLMDSVLSLDAGSRFSPVLDAIMMA